MWSLQERVAEFDRERYRPLGPGYLALNIAGEAGELANLVKKMWRRDARIADATGYEAFDAADLERVADELADVVLTCVVLCNHLHIDIEAAIEKKLVIIDERLRAGYYGNEAKG